MENIINDAVLAGRNVNNDQDDLRRNIVLPTYNPLARPANLDIAEKHGKAKKVYVSKHEDHLAEEGREVCVCCGLPLEGEIIPLNANLDKLYHLGSGFALYFRFIKYAVGMLFLVLFISGIYNLITNSIGADCVDVTTDTAIDIESAYCTKGYILSYALPNKRTEIDLLTAQAALNLAVVVVVMLFFHYLRYQFRKTEIQADDRTTTPSDYTIVIEGLLPETTNQEIVEWIKGFATEAQPLVIEKIIRPFDINDYLSLTTERNKIIQHEQHHKDLNEKIDEHEEKRMEAHLNTVNQKIENLRKEGAIKKCPVAYVIFRTAAQAEIVRSKFKKPLLSRMFGIFMAKFVTTFDQIKGVRVEVERAPEPTDINWLNQKYTDKDRQTKRFITNFITFLLIVMSFGVIILVNWGQNKALQKFGKGSPTVQGLSIVASVVIVVTNTALTLTIDFLTRYEKHATNTQFLRGVTQKLAVAQFVNTALTSLFAELILAEPEEGHEQNNRIRFMNFYGKGGLLEGIYWVFITNAFLGPVLTIFDFAYFMKLFQQSRLKKQGENNKIIQKDANLLFEGTSLNMPAKYAAMIKIILMTTFYAPALPFALVFTIVGLFLSYWADKYALLRRNALPNSLDDDLTDAMVEFLEWAACTFAIGNLIYVYSLEDLSGELAFNNESMILAWVTLGVSLFHIVFPMEALNIKLFPLKDTVTETETYQQVRLEFNTDYDIEDPNTRLTALTRFIKKVKNIPTGSPDKAFFNSVKQGLGVKEELLAAGNELVIPEPVVDFDSIDNYANRMKDLHSPTQSPKVTSPKKAKALNLDEIITKVGEEPTTKQKSPHFTPNGQHEVHQTVELQEVHHHAEHKQGVCGPQQNHKAHQHIRNHTIGINDDESANLNSMECGECCETEDLHKREEAIGRSLFVPDHLDD